jgi:conjugal transfer pilus assembly protein TraF
MIEPRNSVRLLLLFAFAFVFVIGQWFFLLIEAVAADNKAKGWHWYNEVYLQDKNEQVVKEVKETKEEKEVKSKKNKKSKKSKKKENTAAEQIIALRKIVDEAKAKAVLYPTVENLREYIMLQNYVVNQATMFSRVWQKALLEYPELDFTVTHPTQNAFQHIVLDEEVKKEEEAVKEYSKTYGLLFFYRGNNKLDEALSETVQDFSNSYRIGLIPVTVDGKSLLIFKDSKADEGRAKKLGIKYFPALVLVDPKSQKIIPLHYGFISYTGLRSRFLQLVTDFKRGE